MAGTPDKAALTPNTAAIGSRVTELRIALVGAFLASCGFFFFFSTSAAVQHDRVNGPAPVPAWIVLLGFGFYLAPYIISWFLLSTREQTSIASGAGVACGFFGAFLIVSPYALVVMWLFVGLSANDRGADHGLLAAGLTLLVFMVISLWIVWQALGSERFSGIRSA